MNKTLSTLALLGLLAAVPAASANGLDDTVAVNDDLASPVAVSAATCEIVAVRSDTVATSAVAWRLFVLRDPCGGNILLPAGCTLTYGLALAGATLWYVNYVYVTPVSPANEVAGASTFAGMGASATLVWVSCI